MYYHFKFLTSNKMHVATKPNQGIPSPRSWQVYRLWTPH